jgi:hypothetical protein
MEKKAVPQKRGGFCFSAHGLYVVVSGLCFCAVAGYCLLLAVFSLAFNFKNSHISPGDHERRYLLSSLHFNVRIIQYKDGAFMLDHDAAFHSTRIVSDQTVIDSIDG